MRKYLSITMLCIFLLSTKVIAGGSVTAKVSLSPIGSFEIKSDGLKGKILKTNKTFTAKKIWLKIETLSTGLELRDKHMLEKFNHLEFPKIAAKTLKGIDGKGTGLFQIKDVEKDMTFTYKEISANQIQVDFSLKLSDFNFKKISYLGVSVEDEILIQATLDFKTK